MGKFQAGSRKAWSLTNQRTCCAVTLSQAGASASLPPSAQGEPLSSGRTPPSALPPRAVVRSEQIMDVRPRKGFCVMLININDLTCSRLLLPGPGPAASPRGGPGGAAGEPWTSRLPLTPPSGRPPPTRGDLDRTSSRVAPRFFPWATAPTRTGWPWAWKAATSRSCTSASPRSTSCTFTRAACCRSSSLPAVCPPGGRVGLRAAGAGSPDAVQNQKPTQDSEQDAQLNLNLR